MNWKSWLKGLVAAIVNGIASGIVLLVADPVNYNVEQWPKLLTVSGLLGLLGAANYLKQAPLPDDDAPPVNPTRFATLLLIGALLTFGGVSAAGCAAKTPLAKAQVAALSAGKAALGIDQAEYDTYGAGAYDKKTHDAIGVPIRSLLYAVRGHERAVAAWTGDPYASPDAVAKAKAAVAASIGDLEAALQPVNGADKIRAAIRALKLAMGFPLPPADALPAPAQAGLPILALLGLIWKTYQERDQSGTSGHFFAEMVAALKKSGVSAEDLAVLDAELTAAIARRDAGTGE